LVTGSYDHTVRAWNMQGIGEDGEEDGESRCVSVMDHGAPVECLLAIQPPQRRTLTTNRQKNTGTTTPTPDPNSSDNFPIVLSAGGTIIKVWNPILGTCLATIRTKHSKTITSLSMASILRDERAGEDGMGDANGQVLSKRLLSAGLDGLIRIYAADELYHRDDDDDDDNTTKSRSKKKTATPTFTLPYVHGVKTAHPITSLALSPCNTRLVLGTTLGTVTVRQRAKFVPQGVKRAKRKAPRAGTFAHFAREGDATPDTGDHLVAEQKRKKLAQFDKFLKAFQYGKALDCALKGRDIRAIIAVLEELARRKGLITALSNRDEETLEPILSFTATNIRIPRHTPVLVGVANLLIEIYRDVFGQSDRIDEYFRKLHVHVRNEVMNQRLLLGLVGQIDAVMYQAEVMGGVSG